jgi:hypothetical protein
MGGMFFYFGVANQAIENITQIKYNKGIRWPPFNILHATTNQKHTGVTEGGWDRPRNCVRALGEHDGNKKPLAEGNDNNNDKYGKDSNIPKDDDEYAVGVDGVNKPLDKGGDEECDTLSAAPA